MAQSDVNSGYSAAKILQYIDRLSVLHNDDWKRVCERHQEAADLHERKAVGPVQVQLILTNRCNQRCRFCAYRMPDYISAEQFCWGDQIETPKVREILEDCAYMGVRGVQFTGGGEPLMHPDWRELFEYARDLGMHTALVTNGTLLRSEMKSALLRATWIRVSVDAGCAATYARLRRSTKGVYRQVLENIRQLCKWRDATGVAWLRDAPGPVTVGVGFVVSQDNYREVVDAARTAREIGADSFRISAVFQSENERYFRDIYDEAKQLCREATQLSGGKFMVSNRFEDRVADLQRGTPDYTTCWYQHICTYIGADLKVFRCCNTAYSEIGLLGSLKKQAFRKFWPSMDRGRPCKLNARRCPRCQFNEINRMAEMAMRKPTHSSFP